MTGQRPRSFVVVVCTVRPCPAVRHCLNKAEIDRMALAFEHQDLRAAQQGGSAKA